MQERGEGSYLRRYDGFVTWGSGSHANGGHRRPHRSGRDLLRELGMSPKDDGRGHHPGFNGSGDAAPVNPTTPASSTTPPTAQHSYDPPLEGEQYSSTTPPAQPVYASQQGEVTPESQT